MSAEPTLADLQCRCGRPQRECIQGDLSFCPAWEDDMDADESMECPGCGGSGMLDDVTECDECWGDGRVTL